jgi:hypothetical protein
MVPMMIVGAGAAAVTSAMPSTATSAASGGVAVTMAAGVAPPSGSYIASQAVMMGGDDGSGMNHADGPTGVYSGICLFVYHLPPTCNESVLYVAPTSTSNIDITMASDLPCACPSFYARLINGMLNMLTTVHNYSVPMAKYYQQK